MNMAMTESILHHHRPHRWVMVGYWNLEHDDIQQSFESNEPMKMANPDEVQGPGCMDCEVHWVDGKDTSCPGVKQNEKSR